MTEVHIFAVLGAILAVSNWIGAVGLVVGLVASAGGGVAYFGERRGRSVIDLQASEITAQAQRIATLEANETRAKSEISGLQTSLRALTETVTNAAKVDALARRVDENHDESMRLLRGIMTRVGERTADG